jgi:VWFA-related protein
MKKSNAAFLFSSLVFFNSLFSASLVAQNQKTEQEQVLKLKTELISVRAVVTDKSGKVVDGLKKEDFEILESNQLQEISFFSLEKIAGDANEQNDPKRSSSNRVNQTLSSPPSPATVRRTVVLLVDTLHIAQENIPKLKETLKQFVATKLTAGDTVALITTDGQLGVLEQFTQDRQILRKAIDRLRAQFLEVRKSLFTPYLAAEVLKRNPDALTVGKMIIDFQNGGAQLRPGRTGAVQRQEAEVLNEARTILLRETSLRQASLATLKAVAERLAEMPGQRILTLFSDGFTLLSDSGVTDFADMKAVTGRAVRAGVVIYSFDTKGLVAGDMVDASHSIFVTPRRDSREADISSYWSSLRASAARELQEGVSTLALETGGKAIFNTNDLSPGLSRALDENRTYYTLDYYSSNGTEANKFRPIQVRVKNHPDYEVRAQKGYLSVAAKKEDEKEATPTRQLIQAMRSPLPVTDIQVAAVPNFFELEGDDAQVSLVIFIDANSLHYLEKEQRHRFDVDLAIAFHDKSGKVIKTLNEKMQGGLTTEQLAAARRNGYRYTKRLALEPGIFNIRIGLYDNNSGKIGTAIAWTEVPNLKKGALTLSNLILAAAEENGSTNQAEAASRSTWRKGMKVYKSGETLSYLAKVYNLSDEANLLMQSQIYEGDAMVYQSDWLPLSARMTGKDKKGIEFSQELQLGNANPGIYEVKVTVKDKKSNQTAEVNTVFRVER